MHLFCRLLPDTPYFLYLQLGDEIQCPVWMNHRQAIGLLGKGYLTNFVFCVVGAVTVLWLWEKLFD